MTLNVLLIAEALIAPGDGKQKLKPIGIRILNVTCDLDFIGDVSATRTLGAVCEIIIPEPHSFNYIAVECDTDFLGDVQKENIILASCSTTFLGDAQGFNTLGPIFVVIQVSTP